MTSRAVMAAAAAAAMTCAGLGAGTSMAAAGRPAASTPATSTAPATTWGHDQNVPGVAALNTGYNAGLDAVSCGSAGNCSAAGYYTDSSQVNHAFVANEVNGVWQNAQPIPGMASLGSTESGVNVDSLSCSSAGNCSVGGVFAASGGWHPYVANEVKGTWQDAQRIPGMASLNTGTNAQAQMKSVSCPSDGNCGAIGSYTDSSGAQRPFVVDEVNGTWQDAQQVLDATTWHSLSCPSAGNCSAAGIYVDSSGDHAFTVDEVNGTWQAAQPVKGLATLNTGHSSGIGSLSCASAGDCSAAGYYKDSALTQHGFTVDEVNGAWGSAQPVPAMGTGAYPIIGQVSCTSPGNCGGAGGYTDSSGSRQPIVADEVNGTWGNFQKLSGLAALGAYSSYGVRHVSCPTAGNCAGIGLYTVRTQQPDGAWVYDTYPMTVDEVSGTWGDAQPVPGMSATGADYFLTLSCPAAHVCTAGGIYTGGPTVGHHPFVVHEPVVSTSSAATLSQSSVTYGSEQAGQIAVAVSPASGSSTPTGTVTVSASASGGSSVTVCTITLASGAGSCSLAADQLPAGSYQVTASYSGDAYFGPSVSPGQALTVNPGPDTVTLSNPGAQTTTAGGPVDLQIQGASEKGLALSYSASGLPPGISVSGGGLLTGWPEQLGTYQATVTATDSLGGSGSVSFSWSVNAASDSGPAGHLRVKSGGKCLTDVGNRSRNGNPVELWTCHSWAKSQRWTLAQDQTIRIHGKCLTAPHHVGWKVRIQSCTGWASRRWELIYPHAVRSKAGHRPIAYYNPASGLCLAEPGWHQANGTRIKMERCDGYTNQEWAPPAGPITSEVAGMCVNLRNGKSYNGNEIQIWTCNGWARQRWQPKADGTIRIHGKCLTIAHNGHTVGSIIWLYTCWGGTNQQWRLTPTGGGTQIRNPHSGLCLTDPNAATTNGTQLILGTCTTPPPASNWRLR